MIQILLIYKKEEKNLFDNLKAPKEKSRIQIRNSVARISNETSRIRDAQCRVQVFDQWSIYFDYNFTKADYGVGATFSTCGFVAVGCQ